MKKLILGVIALLIVLVTGLYLLFRPQYASIMVEITDPNVGVSIYANPTLEGKTVILERMDSYKEYWDKVRKFSQPNGRIEFHDLPVPSKWQVVIWWKLNEYKALAVYTMGKSAHRYNHIITIGSGGQVTFKVTNKVTKRP